MFSRLIILAIRTIVLKASHKIKIYRQTLLIKEITKNDEIKE